jgi:hypothetical protein
MKARFFEEHHFIQKLVGLLGTDPSMAQTPSVEVSDLGKEKVSQSLCVQRLHRRLRRPADKLASGHVLQPSSLEMPDVV